MERKAIIATTEEEVSGKSLVQITHQFSYMDLTNEWDEEAKIAKDIISMVCGNFCQGFAEYHILDDQRIVNLLTQAEKLLEEMDVIKDAILASAVIHA